METCRKEGIVKNAIEHIMQKKKEYSNWMDVIERKERKQLWLVRSNYWWHNYSVDVDPLEVYNVVWAFSIGSFSCCYFLNNIVWGFGGSNFRGQLTELLFCIITNRFRHSDSNFSIWPGLVLQPARSHLVRPIETIFSCGFYSKKLVWLLFLQVTTIIYSIIIEIFQVIIWVL